VISFLATEWVEGESLRDRLKRSKPLPLEDALRISEDILRGLTYAHAKGVIHRDIKPANILLSTDGQAKIADFGIARPANSTLTQVVSMLGTPNYMSPEQVKCADVTARSDLFSLGVVMYEMLTGHKPFTAPEVSGILRNVVERVPPLASEVNPDVPEAIGRFVARLLPKAPEERFATAGEALRELQVLRGSTPTPPPDMLQLEPAPVDAVSISEGSSSKIVLRWPLAVGRWPRPYSARPTANSQQPTIYLGLGRWNIRCQSDGFCAGFFDVFGACVVMVVFDLCASATFAASARPCWPAMLFG